MPVSCGARSKDDCRDNEKRRSRVGSVPWLWDNRHRSSTFTKTIRRCGDQLQTSPACGSKDWKSACRRVIASARLEIGARTEAEHAAHNNSTDVEDKRNSLSPVRWSN